MPGIELRNQYKDISELNLYLVHKVFPILSFFYITTAKRNV
jgi:hypothetical protein